MKDAVTVPKTNAGRESQNKVFLWFTWLDLLIVALTALLPAFLVIFVGRVMNWWIILVIAVAIGWAVLITYPFGGVKIYYFLWDAIFRWAFATKKHYTTEQAKIVFCEFLESEESQDEYVRFYERKTKLGKTKQACCFYEITPNDISLSNQDELDIYLDKFSSLFTLTDDVNISLIKMDWPYDFGKNSQWLLDNFNTWKNKYKISDTDLKQLNIAEKINQVSNLENHNVITQKRYFLIINADNEEKAKRAFGIIQPELYDAGLRVSPATKEATEACISKLIPSMNAKQSIDFAARHYVIDKANKQECKYYRTIILTSVPKIVFAFWNQGIFNLDDVTINMVIKSIEKTASMWNKDPKQRYVTRLNTLALDRKARNIVEQAAKEYELGSIADLANDVANGDEKIKIVKYLITFSSNSKAGLKARERQIKTSINKAKMRMNYCTCKQWDAYKANIPTFDNILEKECNMMLSSTALTLSYPFIYSDYLDEKGDLYGYKVNGANPLMIDFTKVDDKINMWNTFLFGKSGGGKTTAVKKILRNFIVNPRFRKIFLIDPENEYTNAVKNFGGDVIDCSGLSTDGGKINPFEIFLTSDDEGVTDNHNTWQQHFFFLEEFFDGLYSHELDRESQSILSAIVVMAYNKKRIYPSTNFKKLKPKDWPIFTDIAKEAEALLLAARKNPLKSKYKISSLEAIYYPLAQFAKDGVFSSLWNGPTNIKFDNRIVCFNIQKLNKSGVPQRLKTTQMRLLLRFIEDLCIENKDFNEKLGLLYDDENCYHTAVFCDEFHLLINKRFTAPLEWFYGFIKRIRKYKGRAVLITQNINDMVSDEEIIRLTTGIINSCQFMFIFKLLANDITNLDRLLAQVGGLKNEEINFLKTGEQGQAIFVSGNDIHIKMKFLWDKSLEQDCLNNDMSGYEQIIEQQNKADREAQKIKDIQIHKKVATAAGKA